MSLLYGNSGLGTLLTLPIKRKIFVSYHHDSDQWYYNEFSRFFSNQYEVVQDNSLDRLIDSYDSDYVMRRIRENYITGTSCTIVLCGPQTRWRKYADWEIKATLDKQHGLIGVKLPNNSPEPISGGCHKPDRLQDNIDSGYAVWTTWETLTVDNLRSCIEIANGKPKGSIKNDRIMRSRNG
ncbi:hypothetical protein GURASL_23180 [Geotalea uraniireducens]|uniref:Thoeris protein ThsB TIR-like domain-containing protein n=1 Tax=Geotalea uraniireducens TaxID=351604 RepID=A0ABN6VY24_9BACT|nr:TIR domain-containing protein [Geotalea uraniireducens]BDV43395.1 hypothetical protein GURASL_23180 [Geotalea uraniireducens]